MYMHYFFFFFAYGNKNRTQMTQMDFLLFWRNSGLKHISFNPEFTTVIQLLSALDPLWSILSTAARMSLLKGKVDHATPLLKTLQCPPTSQRVKVKVLQRPKARAPPFPFDLFFNEYMCFHCKVVTVVTVVNISTLQDVLLM